MPPNSSQLASAQLRDTDGLNTENFGKNWPLKKEERALSVRLSIASTPGEYALLLQETEHLDPVIFEAQFHLTKREAEVLPWLSQGKPNAEIAATLGTTPKTITKNLERIFAKLGVETRTGAANMALELVRR